MREWAKYFFVLRGKAKVGILVEGIALLAAAAFAFMLVSYILDRNLRLEMPYRLALLLLAAGLAHLLYHRILRQMQVYLGDDELALALERKDQGLRQLLISALQFQRTIAKGEAMESVPMMHTVIQGAQDRVSGMQGDHALDGTRVLRFLGLMLLCIVLPIGWLVLDMPSVKLWAQRNLMLSSIEWPRLSQLSFAMDANDRMIGVAQGDDLTISVSAKGVIPDQVRLHYRFAGEDEFRQEMLRSEGKDGVVFSTTLESVIANAELYARGGDGRTEDLSIRILERPKLDDLQVMIQYPEYMQESPQQVVRTAGEIRLPAASKLQFQATTSKPIQRASANLGQDQQEDFQVAQDGLSFQGTLQPDSGGVLTLDVLDRDSLGMAQPVKLYLRMVEDQQPAVDFKTQGIGAMISYKARVPGILRVRDDYGLTKVSTWMRVYGTDDTGDEAKGFQPVVIKGMVPFAQTESSATYESALTLDLLDFNKGEIESAKENKIQPGQLLALRCEASDNFGPGEPHTGMSDVITLRVVPEKKLLEDLQRRQYEQRREVEQILTAEKEARAEMQEILAPNSDNPSAAKARLKILGRARQQRSMGKRVSSLGKRYRQILDEYFNNRIMKAAAIATQRQAIQAPLELLAQEEFPSTALLVEQFADSGDATLREAIDASYASIISTLRALLKQMVRLESLAGILESLRDVKQAEVTIQKHVDTIIKDLESELGGSSIPPSKGEDQK